MTHDYEALGRALSDATTARDWAAAALVEAEAAVPMAKTALAEAEDALDAARAAYQEPLLGPGVPRETEAKVQGDEPFTAGLAPMEDASGPTQPTRFNGLADQ
ncbi:MAG: hypothetical protein AAFQ22_07215 [Pseudomonadota bacterium]